MCLADSPGESLSTDLTTKYSERGHGHLFVSGVLCGVGRLVPGLLPDLVLSSLLLPLLTTAEAYTPRLLIQCTRNMAVDHTPRTHENKYE